MSKTAVCDFICLQLYSSCVMLHSVKRFGSRKESFWDHFVWLTQRHWMKQTTRLWVSGADYSVHLSVCVCVSVCLSLCLTIWWKTCTAQPTVTADIVCDQRRHRNGLFQQPGYVPSTITRSVSLQLACGTICHLQLPARHYLPSPASAGFSDYGSALSLEAGWIGNMEGRCLVKASL